MSFNESKEKYINYKTQYTFAKQMGGGFLQDILDFIRSFFVSEVKNDESNEEKEKKIKDVLKGNEYKLVNTDVSSDGTVDTKNFVYKFNSDASEMTFTDTSDGYSNVSEFHSLQCMGGACFLVYIEPKQLKSKHHEPIHGFRIIESDTVYMLTMTLMNASTTTLDNIREKLRISYEEMLQQKK